MALNNLGLGIVFRAEDLTSNIVRRIDRSLMTLTGTMGQGRDAAGKFTSVLTKFSGALKTAAKGATIAAIGFVGLKAAFGAPVNEAATLEDILIQIQAKAGLTSDQVKVLTDDFLKLSSALPLSAEELAKVGVVAGQLGIADPEQIKALALRASQLFRAAKDFGSEESAAKLLARLSGLMGLAIEDSNQLASSLIKLGNTTRTTASQIAESVSSFAGAARAANLAAADANAFAATILAAGVTTQVAGSGMTRILTEMAARTSKFAEFLGLTEEQYKRTFSRDAAGTLQTFIKRFSELDQFQRPAALKEFGLQNIRVQKVLNALALSQGDLNKALADSRGAFKQGTELQKQFDLSTKSLNAQLDTLKGTIQNIKISIGQILLPVVTLITKAFNALFATFLSLPQVVREFLTWGLVIGSTAAFVIGLKIAIVALIPVLKAIAVATGLAALPFIKIIAVLALVTAAVVAIRIAWQKNFGGLRDFVMPIIDGIALAWNSLTTLLSEGKLEGDLAKRLVDSPAIFAFVDFVSRAFAQIQAFAQGVWEAIAEDVNTLGPELVAMFAEFGAAVGEIFMGIGEIFAGFADLLGLEQPGKEGISVIRTIGKVLTIALVRPFTVLARAVVFTVRVFQGLVRAIVWVTRLGIAIVRFLIRPFKTLGAAIIAPFVLAFAALKTAAEAVGQLLKDVFSPVADFFVSLWDKAARAAATVFTTLGNFFTNLGRNLVSAFVTLLNGLATPLNNTLEGAALAADALGQKGIASKLRGAKIEIKEEDISIPSLPSFSLEKPASPSAQAAPSPPPVASTTPPASAPVPQQQGGTALTGADIAAIVTALEQRQGGRTFRGQPIVVEGQVTLDGRAVGELGRQRERDRAARQGVLRGANRR